MENKPCFDAFPKNIRQHILDLNSEDKVLCSYCSGVAKNGWIDENDTCDFYCKDHFPHSNPPPDTDDIIIQPRFGKEPARIGIRGSTHGISHDQTTELAILLFTMNSNNKDDNGKKNI